MTTEERIEAIQIERKQLKDTRERFYKMAAMESDIGPAEAAKYREWAIHCEDQLFYLNGRQIEQEATLTN